MTLTKKRSIDATEGPIFSKMVTFVIPLMLTNLMQQLYSVADSIVVGRFSGNENALAAIGSTSTFIALITALVTGFSAGASVVIAKSFGARDNISLKRGVHTAVTFSFILGISLAAIAALIAKPMLDLLDTHSILMKDSLTYLFIIISGFPAVAVYNFGASTLRAVGDSRTPFYTLTASGILNVILNFVFVVGFGFDVEGVAIGTISSQYMSAVIVLIVLAKRRNESYGLNLRSLGINKATLLRMLRLGVPAAIQGSLFGITNLCLIRALNDFNDYVLSARTIATSIDVLLSTVINTYLHVSMTFTGQNFGAGKPERIKKSLLYSLLQVVVIGVVVGQIMLIFYKPLVGLYINADVSPEAKVEILKAAKEIMTVMLSSYFIGAISEALSGFLRGLGYSLPPMIVSLIGVCGFRMLWIFFVYPNIGTLTGLYLVYPISWTLTNIGLAIMGIFVWKRKIKPALYKQKENKTVNK